MCINVLTWKFDKLLVVVLLLLCTIVGTCLCWVVGLCINVKGIHVFIAQGFSELGSLQRGTSGWLVF